MRLGFSPQSTLPRRGAATPCRTPLLRATKQHNVPALSLCPHPDALRRRQEAEQGAVQRQLEKAAQRRAEAAGLKWWQQGTQHISLMATVQQFQEQLARHSDKLVVAACFSEDCFICRTMHPKLHKIAAEVSAKGDVVFVKLNGSSPIFKDFFQELDIKSVPWFLFIRNGKVVHGMTASLSPERLQSFKQTLSKLRMRESSGVQGSSITIQSQPAVAPLAIA